MARPCTPLACLLLGLACTRAGAEVAPSSRPAPASRPGDEDPRQTQRRLHMVETQIAARGVRAPAVLEALRRVPRHRFVRPADRDRAYRDHPLPIAEGQTISQPYIVALMSELAALRPGDKVLEIGTGSGYQAAVLAALGAEVYSIEIAKPLADSARTRLQALGYRVQVRHGDGYAGWPSEAPFDAIVVTAAPPQIPPPLLAQLKLGGRLVVPVGRDSQDLQVVTRTPRGFETRSVLPVLFVPMTGEAQKPR